MTASSDPRLPSSDPSRRLSFLLDDHFIPTRGPDRLIGNPGRLYQIEVPPEPLKPLYTEKLPKSPAFKSVAELTQRRRDFWSKIVARAGIAMMVAAPVVAMIWGAGKIPAGLLVSGLIIFIAICFIHGERNKSRLL